MWKKIAIVAILVIVIKVAFDFIVKKIKETAALEVEKIIEDKADMIIPTVEG